MDEINDLVFQVWAPTSIWRPMGTGTPRRLILTPRQIWLIRAWLLTWLMSREYMNRDVALVIVSVWTTAAYRAWHRSRRWDGDVIGGQRYFGRGFS